MSEPQVTDSKAPMQHATTEQKFQVSQRQKTHTGRFHDENKRYRKPSEGNHRNNNAFTQPNTYHMKPHPSKQVCGQSMEVVEQMSRSPQHGCMTFTCEI